MRVCVHVRHTRVSRVVYKHVRFHLQGGLRVSTPSSSVLRTFDHPHIVGAVTNGQGHGVLVLLDQVHHPLLLEGRDSATDHSLALAGRLQEVQLQLFGQGVPLRAHMDSYTGASHDTLATEGPPMRGQTSQQRTHLGSTGKGVLLELTAYKRVSVEYDAKGRSSRLLGVVHFLFLLFLVVH